MVGRLAGWFMYLLALPNWVSMFQNLIGCSYTMSFTLHDLVFLWLGFQGAGSVHCTQYEQSCIHVSIFNPIFLAVYSLNRFCPLVGREVVSCPWFSVYSWNNYLPVSSLQWQVWGDNVLNWVFLILGHLGNIASVPEVGVRVHFGLFCRPKRKVPLLLQDLVLLNSWWVLSLCICPNLLDIFRVSWV